MTIQIRYTPEQARDIIDLVRAGESTKEISKAYNRSDAWVSTLLNQNGMSYSQQTKTWTMRTDKGDATMNGTAVQATTTDGWNLSNQDYEKLLEPERPARIQTVDVTVNAPETPDDTQDADFEEARALLARAAQMRRDDKQKIHDLSAQLESALQRIDYLESEEKRLHKENKRIQSEISRRLLRQDMDDLRAELDN